VSERSEFVTFAREEELSLSALCRRFGISRKTGYKWLRRARDAGPTGLADRSRRPRRSPLRTDPAMEQLICHLRQEHPAWGGRKLHHLLRYDGVRRAPAPSTITDILRRHGLLNPERRTQRDWQRFEAPAPNALWQMDFKGDFPVGERRCYPLTVLDDHSRFNLCLQACPNQQGVTVQERLTGVFQRYGLPERLLVDNGPPWGSTEAHPHTWLTAWFIRLGITVSHGHPHHPQTQGKEERFHRTLAVEVLARRPMGRDWADVQADFDTFRDLYNFRRPHEALGHLPPASRYQPSVRSFPTHLPAIEYAPGDQIRKVDKEGHISFRGRPWLVSRAFVGEPVGLRAVADGVWDIYYCHQRVGKVDVTACQRGA
jgi:transposase InsO family protein